MTNSLPFRKLLRPQIYKKKCKWKYVQNQGILIMEKGSQLTNPKAAKVIEGSKQAAAKRA